MLLERGTQCGTEVLPCPFGCDADFVLPTSRQWSRFLASEDAGWVTANLIDASGGTYLGPKQFAF